jgi:hypothetical protein
MELSTILILIKDDSWFAVKTFKLQLTWNHRQKSGVLLMVIVLASRRPSKLTQGVFFGNNIHRFWVVRGFQDCLKIHSNLNRLSEWCGSYSLKLNVRKCKSITFSRLRHPVEFSYMLGGIVLDRVDSITDLGVVMDRRMSFNIRHMDITVERVLAMLGFGERLLCEFNDP